MLNLKNYNSLQIQAQCLGIIDNLNSSQTKEIMLLGEGTNVILSSNIYDFYLYRIFNYDLSADSGIEIVAESGDSITIDIDPELSFDKLVEWTVNKGYADLAPLSLIPGSVGSAPVQNIGAYGSQISDNVVSLNVLDIENSETLVYSNEECNFSYRSSIFKPEVVKRFSLKGNVDKKITKYIITKIRLNLKQKHNSKVTYKALINILGSENEEYSAEAIRKAVIEIRKSKLPDWHKIANVGSFFKNPTLNSEEHSKNYSLADLKYYLTSENNIKLYAGEIIEKVGLKGYKYKNWEISSKQALVIIGNGEGSYKELADFVELIQNKISDQYGIMLEIEPEVI